MEGTGSGQGFRLFTIFPRIGAIVLAVILLIVSAVTLGIISNNDTLDTFQKSANENRDILTDDQKDLLNLINGSLGAAGWLIVMSIVIVIAEIIFTVIAIVNIQPTVKLIFGIIEILFSGGVILSYFATGIACAVYASQWRKKPFFCENIDNVSEDDDDICDSVPLSATNALEAVFCFIQLGVFGLIAAMIVLNILKSRRQTT